MGIIIPNMGMDESTSMADALFTPVQQRVLALLFGQPDRRYQSAELIRLARGGTGAVHRQLARLAESGLVTVTRQGNQKHYQAFRGSPVFADLHGLVVKTVGVVEPIRRALAPIAARMRAAFVYGSVAKRTDRARSDIDLMVLSDSVRHDELYELLQAAEAELARPINPMLMSVAQWRSKRRQGGSFAARVAKAPHLFVVGTEDDLERA